MSPTIHRDVTKKANGVAAAHTAADGSAVVAKHGKSQIDRNLIGVCVVATKTGAALRLSLRPHHMKDLGGKRIDIRGTLGGGLLLVAGKAYKPYQVSVHLWYLQLTLSAFDSRIAQQPRALIWLRPIVEDGHIKLPGMPEAWLRGDPEFHREVYHEAPHIFETGKRTVQLSPFPADGGTPTKAETVRVEPVTPPRPPATEPVTPPRPPAASNGQGVTAPMPKATVAYRVPDTIQDMEYDLAAKIDEVRAIVKAMEEKTGLQFVLDRNLRVSLVLRTKEPNK